VDLTLRIKRGKPVAIKDFKVNSPYVYCRVFADEPPYEQGPLEQVEPNQNTVFPSKIKVFKRGEFNETGNPESPAGRNSIMTVKGLKNDSPPSPGPPDVRTAQKTSVTGTFQLTVFRGVEGYCETGIVSFTTAPTG
jgi:hypothetical protein